ncbi:non-ribosomal peptide synthetase [Staphylococcus saprophyticus]|uniref:non-ribosomal peptide synthetase n=1 Tax=Staphylococcus saprophyticus TaxID=29385 RepID=UPI0024C2C36A|nr:non-ribosomal peptide synthetase [Staphylococcus saprophyticus]MDK1672847.1 non-ribosomal peptide synthetase [Staphylococcus saprophyticus]
MIDILNEFKRGVNELPNKIAIYDSTSKITYKELDEITTQFAKKLLNYNIQENKVIPLILEPSKETIIAIIALYKLGLAYTPISVKFPLSRIELLVEDSKSNLLITSKDITIKNNIKIINILSELNDTKFNVDEKNENELIQLQPNDLAYIIYTSGSTGKPKGVEINHSNLSNLLANMQKYYPIEKGDNYILSTPYTFDVSVVEIFGWIIGKGSLYITNAESGDELKNLLNQVINNNITHMALSPAVLSMLLNVNDSKTLSKVDSTLKYLMIAGEEFKPDLANKVKKMLPNVKVDNLYGPTENTVYSTRYRLEEVTYKDYVPIGKTLDNVEGYILDENHNECEIGEVGKLFLAGDSTSKGYYNNVLKTNESFVQIKGKLLYSTGDLCKYDENNNIVFIGRVDSQIQINGIRVELEEIENTMITSIDEIQDCKVLYDNNFLKCFFITNKEIEEKDLKMKTKNILPSYMVPHYYLKVKEFPLNVNRKIDTKQLLKSFESELKYHDLEELSSDELKVRNIFSKVCNKNPNSIGKNDHFFNTLGADSLKNVTCIIYLEKEFDVNLDDGYIYRNPTIEKIVKNLKSNQFYNYDNRNNEYSTSEANAYIKEQLKKSKAKGLYHNLKGIYNTYYLQKVYYYDNFESVITVDLTFPKDTSNYEITEKIIRIIQNNEMLRTVINKDNNSIVFEEYSNITPPLFDLDLPLDYKSEKYKEIKNSAIEMLGDNIIDNLVKNLLYRIILINNNDNKNIILVLSHHIADYSNVHIIKKQFYTSSKPEYTYFDFIDLINENSTMEKAKDIDLNVELNKIGKQALDLEQDNKKEFTVLKYKYSDLNSQDNSGIISSVNYIVSQLICEGLKKESISISTILNLREFSNLSFYDNIGDFHFSLTTIGKLGESHKEFQERIDMIKTNYFNGFSTMNAIFKNYPQMSDSQRYLEELYDLNPTLKTNYLGQIRDENINDIINHLKNTKIQLNKFPVSKLYVTFFNTKNYVYIVFLTTPLIDETLINKYGFESYKHTFN